MIFIVFVCLNDFSSCFCFCCNDVFQGSFSLEVNVGPKVSEEGFKL